MKTWKFKLMFGASILTVDSSNVKNWDSQEETLEINETLRGALLSVSGVYEFIGKARSFIQNAIDTAGMEAELYMQIYEGNESNHDGSFKKSGQPLKACMKSYHNSPTTLKISFAISGFEEKLFNRIDSTINYNISEAIDGETLNAAKYTTLTLPDRVLSGSAELNIPLQDFKFEAYSNGSASIVVSIASNIVNSAIPKVLNVSQTLYEINTIHPSYLAFIQNVSNLTNLHITISNFSIDLSTYNIASLPCILFGVYLQKRNLAGEFVETIAKDRYTLTTLTSKTLAISGEWDVSLSIGQSLELYFEIVIDRGGIEPSDFGIVGTVNGGKIEMYSESYFDQTETRCVLAHEAFERILSQITGSQNSFKSNFFGRTDIGYSSDGEGAYTALLNGLLIRSFPTDEANLTFSLSELLKNMINAFNLVGWIEGNVLHLEKYSDAYNLNNFIEIGTFGEVNVNLIEKDHLTNVKYGYINQSYEEASGLKSFNLQAERQSFIKSSNNKIDFTLSYRADDIGIELARRLDYKHNPTLDYRADNDTFIIICKPNIGGKVIVRLGAEYGAITGIDSPLTAYNIGITPLTVLKNWGNVISSGLYLNPTKKIKFLSGSKNTSLGINGKNEIDDIIVSDLGLPLFLPFMLNVTDAILTGSQWDQIKLNPTTLLKIGYFYGKIDSIKIDRNTMKSEIQLIRANR